MAAAPCAKAPVTTVLSPQTVRGATLMRPAGAIAATMGAGQAATMSAGQVITKCVTMTAKSLTATAPAASPMLATGSRTTIIAPVRYVNAASAPRVMPCSGGLAAAPMARPTVRVVRQLPLDAPVASATATSSSVAPSVAVAPGAASVPIASSANVKRPSTSEVKREADPQLQQLKELRRSSGLKQIPIGDGLTRLKAASSDEKLTREQFIEAYTDLLNFHNIEQPEDTVKNKVFDLFDRDGNHVVDNMELICGISLLCAGSEEEKIHAVFAMFDENGDGFVSLDEMFKFLKSVFRVVLTPNVKAVMNTMGVGVESADDLASVTALECFKTADLNQDGKLSIAEFKTWFYAPRDDHSFLFAPVQKQLQ